MEASRELKLRMYSMMHLIRRFENRASELFRDGRFPGWIHVCIGQEASVTGACFSLRSDDYICPTHRGHGQSLAKGMSPDRMMAELFGKKTGTNLGRGGSMHLCDLENGILCGIAILGDGLPMAAGAAMSAKLAGNGRVALGFFGEGASNEGIVHETMNLAALWDLPMVFFCESNQYAELSHRSAHLKVDTIAKRAAGYGMPGVTVDGNDVLEVLRVTSEAVERAREGMGPTLIESVTCRLHGHYEGDPQVYRIPGDIEQWKAKDPIALFEAKLMKEGVLDGKSQAMMIAEVDRTIASAVEFAEKSPFPAPEEALDLVYA
ncbi:MAG: thiamine pyrophosphate-dependent dehydrogenase E1 component subunit alpha [Desulfobacteria bacterium]